MTSMLASIASMASMTTSKANVLATVSKMCDVSKA